MPNPFKDKLHLSLFREIMKAERICQEHPTKLAQDMGVQLAELHIINILGKMGKLQMGEVVEISVVSTSNTTRTARRLEDKGLLERQRSKESDRVVEVNLTPEGELFFKKAFPKLNRESQTFFDSKLSAEDQKTLLKLLQRLNDSSQE